MSTVLMYVSDRSSPFARRVTSTNQLRTTSMRSAACASRRGAGGQPVLGVSLVAPRRERERRRGFQYRGWRVSLHELLPTGEGGHPSCAMHDGTTPGSRGSASRRPETRGGLPRPSPCLPTSGSPLAKSRALPCAAQTPARSRVPESAMSGAWPFAVWRRRSTSRSAHGRHDRTNPTRREY